MQSVRLMARMVVFGKLSSRLGSEERGEDWFWRIGVLGGVFLGSGNVYNNVSVGNVLELGVWTRIFLGDVVWCILDVSAQVLLDLEAIFRHKSFKGEALQKYKHWY